MGNSKVEDVMTHDPQCCTPDDDLATAAKVMWDLDCGCVPVIGDGRHVVGMLTDRDACMAALLNGRPLHELRVSDVMSKDIVSCKATDDLDDAQRLMRIKRVRRLPVTDSDGRVVGVLSLQDLARTAKEQSRRFFPKVRLREVALTLAEVSHATAKPAPPAVAPNLAYAQ